MRRSKRDRARSPVNSGDSTARQEVCFEGLSTRAWLGAYYLARPGSVPGPKVVYCPKPET